MIDLHQLPTLGDRLSYLYFDHCLIEYRAIPFTASKSFCTSG